MKLFIDTIIGLLGLLMVQVSWAHEGHDHAPVSMKSAIDIALKTTAQYTKKPSSFFNEKLPTSWAMLENSQADIHENGRGYYIVSLHNNVENETLYLKVLLNGDVAGANKSGVFSSTSKNSSTKN